MRTQIFICFLFFGINSLSANCLKGNCNNGKGTYLFSDGSKYTGSFSNGSLHGYGLLIQQDGSVYTGDFKNGVKEGHGKMGFKSGDLFTGRFQGDRINGQGRMKYKNGDVYTGQWVNGKATGSGSYTFSSGIQYEGQFSDGQFHGKGKMKLVDGSSYDGTWFENKKHGSFVIFTSDLKSYNQMWEMDQLVQNFTKTNVVNTVSNSSKEKVKNCNVHYCDNEKGTYTYKDGSVFSGDFTNGLPMGNGHCQYADGTTYTGQWRNNGPNGQGTLLYKNGKIVSGKWNNGKLVKDIATVNNSKTSTKPYQNNQQVIKNENAGATNVYALVVGVASYNHMQSLKYTDDDAYQLYAFLKSPEGGAIPDDKIKILIDDASTRQNILKSLKELAGKADANDVVVLYMSGHGLDGAFVPFDFDGINNLVQYNEVMDILNNSSAQHKLFVTDACHSGSMIAQARTGYQHSLDRLYDAYKDTKGGTAILTSSKKDEVSLEYGGLRQGIFSHFLIRGLKGEADKDKNKLVTVSELFDFVSTNVRAYTVNAQSPSISGNFDRNMPVGVIR
ncbi:MAG: caspase family protein [Saprospiraceae bacterium]|nr:caspase family protein [Saprospiraceae bacterium]